MAETKLIPTVTTAISTVTTLDVTSEYVGVQVNCGSGVFTTFLPNTLLARFFDDDGDLNSVPFVEGELMINGVNMPLDNDIWLETDGDLIIEGADRDAYYIDSDGYLIYDHCALKCLNEYYDCGYVASDYTNP
jgi:hypothetical protein